MTCINSEAYHESELRIALDPQHPAHVSPPRPDPGQHVLDIGCGAGQTLFGAADQAYAFGIDVDEQALRLGHQWSQQQGRRLYFSCASAEALPFADQSFEAVWARVSLPYTDLRRSLPEIRRVLKPGGSVWMVLQTAGVPWLAARSGGWRHWVFYTYIVANSWLFHATGRTVPFFNGRYESFQTAGGIRRALIGCGFAEVEVQKAKHFVVVAR